MIERKFIRENIRKIKIDEFLSKEFSRAGFSHSDIQRTPLAVRVVVYAQRPGMVIGRGGKTIDALADTLKSRFGIENPQVDVQEVENPDLDPHIVAKHIASTIERGLNYKRVANFAIQRVMGAGATGIAIRIAGKVGGDMSRTEKFSAGYLKFAGEPAEKMGRAYATAKVKLGLIGVQVRILTEPPKEITAMKKITQELEAPREMQEEAEPEAKTGAPEEEGAGSKKAEKQSELPKDAPEKEEAGEEKKGEEKKGEAEDGNIEEATVA